MIFTDWPWLPRRQVRGEALRLRLIDEPTHGWRPCVRALVGMPRHPRPGVGVVRVGGFGGCSWG
ncbi:O-succinylbenzoate-CoA ligase [Escherichia coli]|nr:O-succinylbenzoate-CoA ligase [Escherichia coli]